MRHGHNTQTTDALRSDLREQMTAELAEVRAQKDGASELHQASTYDRLCGSEQSLEWCLHLVSGRL